MVVVVVVVVIHTNININNKNKKRCETIFLLLGKGCVCMVPPYSQKNIHSFYCAVVTSACCCFVLKEEKMFAIFIRWKSNNEWTFCI